VVTLESGPASDTSGNGTTIQSISVPASHFLECGNHFSIERWTEAPGFGPPFFKVHWVWVPFSENETFTLGNIYNIRFSASGGFDGKIWTAARGEQQGIAHVPTSWADHEAKREVGMNAWEDSRGVQTSTNSGSSWSFLGRRMAPILFKCVTP
jgi:hypothetical protein